jgi:hypothetical protein
MPVENDAHVTRPAGGSHFENSIALGVENAGGVNKSDGCSEYVISGLE